MRPRYTHHEAVEDEQDQSKPCLECFPLKGKFAKQHSVSPENVFRLIAKIPWIFPLVIVGAGSWDQHSVKDLGKAYNLWGLGG
jgi:hypothetical protein